MPDPLAGGLMLDNAEYGIGIVPSGVSVTGINSGVRSVNREVDGRSRFREADDNARCGPVGARGVSDGESESAAGSEKEVKRWTPKNVVAIWCQISLARGTHAKGKVHEERE